MLQKRNFKIFQITEQTKEKKLIQIQSIENDFKQIIELTNGYLVSISLCQKNKTNVVFWEKNLINERYEFKKGKITTEILSLIEINKYKFIIFTYDYKIIFIESNTGIKKQLGEINVNLNTFKKMLRIDDDRILFHFQNSLILIRISTFQFYKLNIDFCYLCSIYNNNNAFLASFSGKNEYNGLYKVSCDLIKNKIYLNKCSESLHNDNICYIFQLSNGAIITTTKEKDSKIWTSNQI